MKKKLLGLTTILILTFPAVARERLHGSIAKNTLKITNKTGYDMRFYISNLWETGYQQIIHNKSEFTGNKVPFYKVNISFVPDHCKNCSIGTGTSDTVFFKFFNKCCLGKAWWRFCKMLFGNYL